MKNEQKEMFSGKEGFNLMMIVVIAMAMTITVFIRSRFGPRTLGKRVLMALILLLMFSGDPVMRMYLWVWGGAIFFRLLGAGRQRKGWKATSDYDGWPWLAFLVPGTKDERFAKRFVEPALCFCGGIALFCLGEEKRIPALTSLGGWFVLGSIALSIDFGVYEAIERRRVAAIRDARIEQGILLDLMREEEE